MAVPYPPFPLTLNPGDFDIVVGLFVGKYPDLNTALHAIDNVIGYGFGRVAPDKGMIGEGSDFSAIAAIPVGHKLQGSVQAGKIDWLALILELIQLLPTILPFLKPAA